jgi:hypothetical protein
LPLADKPIRFDCAGIRVPKYILKPPDGGTLIVKERFGHAIGVINPDRCLVQTRHKKRADSHDRRRKPEPTSRLSRNLIRRRKIYSLFLGFRSMGVVFFLTTEGHIDVGLCSLQAKPRSMQYDNPLIVQ